ncbi:hypothetical protein [Mesoflavibacter sp. CH_XMU1404-2]|uniref:hypothetical protein n=1 Tax=Mesoflavibacter sp. CH_XMU1404-2 TaxID=3107766 RepID=UPI00300A0451
MNLQKTATIVSILAGVAGLYSWNKNRQAQSTNTQPEQSIVDKLLGKTAYAAQPKTIVNLAKKEGTLWTDTNTQRLIVNQNNTIGTVIAVVTDPYIKTDIYLIIDIPFYVGSPTQVGHGIIKLENVKFQ